MDSLIYNSDVHLPGAGYSRDTGLVGLPMTSEFTSRMRETKECQTAPH
jgi:hypothetical protein